MGRRRAHRGSHVGLACRLPLLCATVSGFLPWNSSGRRCNYDIGNRRLRWRPDGSAQRRPRRRTPSSESCERAPSPSPDRDDGSSRFPRSVPRVRSSPSIEPSACRVARGNVSKHCTSRRGTAQPHRHPQVPARGRAARRVAGRGRGRRWVRPASACGPVSCVSRHATFGVTKCCCHTKHKPYYHTHINHTAHREIAHRAYTEHTPDGRARTQHTHRTTQAPHKGAPRRGHSTEHLCHAPHSTPLGYTLQHRAPAGTPT